MKTAKLTTRGERDAMVAHLIGMDPCPHASDNARNMARQTKAEKPKKKKKEPETSASAPSKRKASEIVQSVAKKMKQGELKVFRGVDIPFSERETDAVKRQFLRATVSANLPFQWLENPEIVKLFLMFHSQADKVIPGRRAISGSLLDGESNRVEKNLRNLLSGKYATLSYVHMMLAFYCLNTNLIVVDVLLMAGKTSHEIPSQGLML